MVNPEDWGMEEGEYFGLADSLALQLLEARSLEARSKVAAVAVRMCDGCKRFHIRAKLADADDGRAPAVPGVGIEIIDKNLRAGMGQLIETLLGEVPEASGLDGRNLYDISDAILALLKEAGVDVHHGIRGIGVKRAPAGPLMLKVVFRDGREFEGEGSDVVTALAALSLQLMARVLQ